MTKEILINDNLDDSDETLLPFPRFFAECVFDILSTPDEKVNNRHESNEERSFVSSVGITLK